MNGNPAYQPEVREEIIGGKVVMMSAPGLFHMFIAGNIYGIFRDFLRGKPCRPIPDGAAVFLEEDKEEYQPDMMVVCDPEKLKPDGVHGAPDLVVEVLSPSTGRYDRGRKRDIYEKHGVREYWIVNPVDRSLEQYVLEEGAFVLRNLCQEYPQSLLQWMKEADRAALTTEFQCGVFPDLTVRLRDVFDHVPPLA